MRISQLVFHVVRLGIAALLLWFDIRLFLFYAFTLLLAALHQIDRLRAVVRVFQVANEARMVALVKALNVPDTAITAALQEMEENMADWKIEDLALDFHVATSRSLVTKRQALRVWREAAS